LKNCIHILILVLTSFFFYGASAQKLSKKEIKEKKQEIMDNIKVLVERGQVDSMLNIIRNQNNVVDTSFQVYESTNSKGGVLEMVVVEGDTIYVYNMEPFAVVDMRPYKDVEKDRQFRRLRWHVRKVYPYAKVASQKLIKYLGRWIFLFHF